MRFYIPLRAGFQIFFLLLHFSRSVGWPAVVRYCIQNCTFFYSLLWRRTFASSFSSFFSFFVPFIFSSVRGVFFCVIASA
ncbi:hypothetical protein BKA66DRAFT_458494, partial [Pyrenochaeta sp. MPI-SDFR-AT-0127]